MTFEGIMKLLLWISLFILLLGGLYALLKAVGVM